MGAGGLVSILCFISTICNKLTYYLNLGWVFFGTCMALTSFFIALFPKRLRKKDGTKIKEREPGESETIPKLSGIMLTKICLFNTYL